jgi:hypothetical protein
MCVEETNQMKGNNYMKLGLLFALQAFAIFAQVPVTVTFNLPSASYLKDVEQSRFVQRNQSALEGALTAAVTNNATSITISGSCPANNVAIYIDSEPMLVTAGSGGQACTVTRNSALTQAGTVATTHAAGATVYELKYPTAQAYFVQVGVAAFVVQCITSLGNSSSVVGANLTAIANAQAAFNGALANTAQ